MKGSGRLSREHLLDGYGNIISKLGYLMMLWMEGYSCLLIYYCKSVAFAEVEIMITKHVANIHIVDGWKPKLRDLSLLEQACKLSKQEKIYQKLLLKKYDCFAMKLGYLNWGIAQDYSYFIYQASECVEWYATLLPNNEWAIWKCSQDKPPYRYIAFHTWQKAIQSLRSSFEQEGLPEWNWKFEGLAEEEAEVGKEPGREKSSSSFFTIST